MYLRVTTLLVVSIAAHGLAMAAPAQQGLRFEHGAWELACDNTGTCRAAGYYDDDAGGDHAISVLLTRKAGARQAVTGVVMLGRYGDNPVVDALPQNFALRLNINGQALGNVPMTADSLEADLSARQVVALLSALRRNSEIAFVYGSSTWSLSGSGASAVLLKIDEFQRRVGTTGALVGKGPRGEAGVLPPHAAPVVYAAQLPVAQAGDQAFGTTHAVALLKAIRQLHLGDTCIEVTDTKQGPPELSASRLSPTKMRVSARCWSGAYNVGYGHWVVNAMPPYAPMTVTTDADSTSTEAARATITQSQKGRGLGDCWASRTWTWDGTQFVLTQASTTGKCMLMAPGGAWSLPTRTTLVLPQLRP